MIKLAENGGKVQQKLSTNWARLAGLGDSPHCIDYW
jgi:hypothetical protein